MEGQWFFKPMCHTVITKITLRGAPGPPEGHLGHWRGTWTTGGAPGPPSEKLGVAIMTLAVEFD